MKLGMWAEKIGILDENPAGFRREEINVRCGTGDGENARRCGG